MIDYLRIILISLLLFEVLKSIEFIGFKISLSKLSW